MPPECRHATLAVGQLVSQEPEPRTVPHAKSLGGKRIHFSIAVSRNKNLWHDDAAA